MLVGTAVTLIALCFLLVAEWRQSSVGIWIAKPLASLGFLLAAMHAPALHEVFGRTVFLALMLSWLGDVLLIPNALWAFPAGLGVFLLGHVAFAVAFAQHGMHVPTFVVAGLVTSACAGGVWRWLHRDIPPMLRMPVAAYLGVISVMLSAAIGSAAHSPHPVWQILGAELFYLSDVMVARQKFKGRSYLNKALGLPLYYVAQLCFARLLYF